MSDTRTLSAAAIDLDVRLNTRVSIPVAAHLQGVSSKLMYRQCREGLIALAPNSHAGHLRVTLRALSDFGVNVSEEALARAREKFATEVRKRNSREYVRENAAPQS